jgi:hypothetical protein
MAALSDTLENALLDATLRNTSYTGPATVYVALYSSNPTDADSGTEITGGGYARQAATFAVASGGSTSNSAEISFPVATANYPAPVTHFGLRSAASAGTLLYHGALSAPVTINQNGQFKFAVGALTVTLA